MGDGNISQPPRGRFTGLWAHCASTLRSTESRRRNGSLGSDRSVATPPQSGRRRSAPPAVRRGLAMAGDDDFADGGGGGLGIDGPGDGAGGDDGDARSDTATSGAGGKLVKRRITLETDL